MVKHVLLRSLLLAVGLAGLVAAAWWGAGRVAGAVSLACVSLVWLGLWVAAAREVG